MAVSIAQYVDLLFKKLQGVAKTANSAVKSASNESIASPLFLRGDVVWMQSDQIPSTAQVVTGVTQSYLGGSSVQCTADNTVPPIGGVYPTWLTNVTYWVPQELGSTWLPKVYVGPPSAANIQATGTQIFADGIGGVGEYYFDTQAGVLNFIGETIPTVLTAGNVVYVAGYQYVGLLGVTNIPSGANIGNLNFSNTTISSTLANGNITLTATGSQLVQISGNSGVVIPAGNTAQQPSSPPIGTTRFNTSTNVLETWDGAAWISGGSGGGGSPGTIVDQQIVPDGTSVNYTLIQAATSTGILVSINGVSQIPDVAYTVANTTITFNQVPLTADLIDIRFISYTATTSTLVNSYGNTTLSVASGNIVFSTANVTQATINSVGTFAISGQSLQLPAYTVAQTSNITTPTAGEVIYVSNGNAGTPSLAVYDGSSWKRIALGNTISAT